MNKLWIIGVICLFISVGVYPVIAVETDDQVEDDCGCESGVLLYNTNCDFYGSFYVRPIGYHYPFGFLINKILEFFGIEPFYLSVIISGDDFYYGRCSFHTVGDYGEQFLDCSFGFYFKAQIFRGVFTDYDPTGRYMIAGHAKSVTGYCT